MTVGEVLKRYANGQRDFRGVDVRRQNFDGHDLPDVDFSDADLRGTSFRNANLRKSRFFNVRCGAVTTNIVLIGFIYILIALFAPTLYSIVSFTFPDGRIIFLKTLCVNLIILSILITAKATLKKPSIIFVDYGGDAVVVGFLAVFFFVYHYLMKSGIQSMTTMQLITRVFLFAICIVVPASLFFNKTITHADDYRFSLSGMWKWFGTDFRGSILVDADFSNSNLRGADFRGSVLMHTCFYNVVEIELATFGDAPKGIVKNKIAIKTGHKFSLYSMQSVRNFVTQQNHQNNDCSGETYNYLYMRGMELSAANLEGSKLTRALLEDANLSNAILRNANCRQTRFSNANLRDADLYEAVLVNANLEGSDLRGASLKLANLEGANLNNSRIDVATYINSCWTPEKLSELVARGLAISLEDLEKFPRDAHERLRPDGGLLLSFSTVLSDVDRNLISNIIFDTLGQETDCRIVDYREQTRMAIVFVKGSRRQDLEKVAEAFHTRIWRTAEKWCGSKKETDPAGFDELISKFEDLYARFEKMEIRWGSGSTGTESARTAIACWRGPTHVRSLPSAIVSNPVRLAIMSAPVDQQYADTLIKTLATLLHEGKVQVWQHCQLLPGSDLSGEYEKALSIANIVIFLVSPDLLVSPFIDQIIRYSSAKLHEHIGFHVIPVLVRATYLENTFFSQYKLKPLPSNSVPVAKWDDADEAWVDVVKGIRRLVDSLVGCS